MPERPSPSLRTLVGIAGILLFIVLWASLIATFTPAVGRWPILAQGLYYLIMGVVWIIPLKPLIRWVQTGSFRRSSTPDR